MTALFTVAGLEIRMGLRNRWVLATTALMAVLALSITTLGSTPTGSLSVGAFAVSTASLASLTIFLVPLMALLLSYDTIVGDIDQGTMLLTLSYPVSRAEVLLGKFLGQSTIIAFATLVGYGLAASVSAASLETAPSLDEWQDFGILIASASLLGAGFVALGTACSSIARQRGAAAGLAVSLWLLFVIVFDLALLGGLVAGLDVLISEDQFAGLLLLNPADIFRILNMGSVAGSGLVSGITAASTGVAISAPALWGSLILWFIVPLSVAVMAFKRRDI